ncbi:MAG: hypothetical protein K2Q33_09205 [Gammaproteobacteria bacterium]|nr:hypothetical protein [Gammaproteobacteria bacterium]
MCFAIGTAATAQHSLDEPDASSVNLSIQDDSLLGPIVELKSAMSFNPEQAGALEVAGGTQVLRINATYGIALNDNNRLKLTTEYLRENLDFSFYTGDTYQWVQQGAIGASYQYLLESNTFKSLEIGSHYSHAPSKDLSTKTIAYTDGSTLTDYRRIAGGNDLNGIAETTLQLWRNSLLTVGTDYDQVRYDTKYEIQHGHDAQGFGGHFRLEQPLKNNIDLQLQSTVSQLYDTYGLGLNWIWHSTQTKVLSTGINSSYTQDHTTERNFWVNAFNLNIVWDTTSNTPSTFSEDKPSHPPRQSLLSWTQIPAVRMPDVLAISDERITTTSPSNPFIPVAGACPLGLDLQYNNVTGQYSANGGWYQSYPQSSTMGGAYAVFDSANIMGDPSGEIECLYGLYNSGMNRTSMILKNNAFIHAAATGSTWQQGQSQFWPQTEPSPTLFCYGNPQDCTFSTTQPQPTNKSKI